MVTWKSPDGVFAVRFSPFVNKFLCHLFPTTILVIGDLFTNGENLTAKTPPGDFQVTTPETPLLSQQVITSKESQVPYQPTVEPLP